MLRILYAILVGLLGAGVVHIAILLLLPAMSDRDAWSRLSAIGELHGFVPLDGAESGASLLASADPHFEAAACRFSLAGGPVRVEAEGRVPFWSVSVYDRSGHNIYSFNDRTAIDGELDLVLATPAQAIVLRRSPPADLEQAIVVEMDSAEGIVLLRSFVPDESWRELVRDYLAGAQCQAAAS